MVASGNLIKPFEPRVKVDTLQLNEQLRSSYGLADTQLSEIKEILQLSKKDIADYNSEIKRAYAAYDAETTRIKAVSNANAARICARHEAEMKHIAATREAEIGKVQAAHSVDMHRMHLRHQGLKKYTEKLSTLLSPIRRIPSELLLRIFVFFCHQNDLSSYEPGDAAALTVGAVCTRWRQLAVSQPTLWANLKIQFDEIDETSEDETKLAAQLTFRVELHLLRSQNQPLSLHLNPLTADHPALILIASESRRWRRLIYSGDDFGLDWNNSFQSLPLPMLETVDFEDSETCDGQSPPLEAFAQAPNIRELSIHSFIIDENVAATFNTAWVKLTDLSYHLFDNLEGFLSTLNYCSKLRRLTVSGENSDLVPVYSIRSHLIVSLYILNSASPPSEHDSMLECLLSSLTLPDLTNLVLLHNGHVEEPFLMPFLILEDFFRRSRCALSSLNIEQICITDTEMVALLAHLPCLQELTCEDPDDGYSPITMPFVRSLHTWERDSLHHSIEPLVPKLRSLTLKVHNKGFDSSTFVDTITSRWLPDETSAMQLGASCLRSIELHLDGAVDAQAYEPLKQFDKAGMRVVVICEDQDGYIV
ncbi:hypothetical protein J3R30DRAFT_217899 [Lentinula aciculospora]|uniref:F-box domain-containing protein n=1 Tax=Lentinula aciculospora TaxID=153920 RepID=A0A9W9DM81_9AGAR|nr:hypothetical protein J3R30DRAFT_217899 [Lentinula aciculospora]